MIFRLDRHFVARGERYFQGYNLKLYRSKDIKVKKITILPAKIAVTPDLTPKFTIRMLTSMMI